MADFFDLLRSRRYPQRKRRSNPRRTDYERKTDKVDREIISNIAAEPESSQMDKDDILLAQIDEFREKAKQLQEMLVTKESKAQELQSIVQEREVKADQLKQILDERQEKVDGIEAEVARQIDKLIVQVNAKMAEIERSMDNEISSITRMMSDEMNQLNRNVAGEVGTLSKSLSSDFRNMEKSLDGTIGDTKKMLEVQTETVRAAVSEANTQMLESLGNLNQQLEQLKAELSEKIHSENVKCFRNIQDIFKSMGDKIDKVSEVDRSVKTVHTFVVTTMIFTIINTVGALVTILALLGVF